MKTVYLFAAVVTALPFSCVGQCVEPPTTTTFTHDFYSAYQKLAITQQSSDSDMSLAVPLDDVPLAFGMKNGDKKSTEDLTKLTTSDATKIVQKELADRKIGILAWCGYSICQAHGNDTAIQALQGVCSLAFEDKVHSGGKFSVSPFSLPVIFDNQASKSVIVWLRLRSDSGVRSTATAFINDQTGHFSLKLPPDSTESKILLDSDAPTRIEVTLNRPSAREEASVSFKLTGADSPDQQVHFHLIPSQEFLLPNADISCGKAAPGFYVLATNHTNGNRENDYETNEVDLVPEVASVRSKSDSFGAGEGGAEVSLSSTCSEVLRDFPKQVVTELELRGTIHAHTGNGFAGTGFHPGGGAGIYPSWKSRMSLPGLAGQLWRVKVNLGNHLIEQDAADGVTCSIKVDGASVNTMSALVGEDKSAEFSALEPGDYIVSLNCTGKPQGFPFHRAQAVRLWNGSPNDVTDQVSVTVRIDAKRP